ncbi:hypothetical protein [Rhizobium leguminosarum]
MKISEAWGLAEKLPDVAGRRVIKIADRLNTAMATLRSQDATYEGKMLALEKQTALVKSYTDPNIYLKTGKPTLKSDDPLLVQAKKDLDRLQREFDYISDKVEAAGTTQQSLLRTYDRISDYLKLRDFRDFTDVPASRALPSDPQKLLAGIKSDQAEIDNKRADRHTTASAAFPSKLALEIGLQQVDDLADRGRPDVSSLIDIGPDGKIKWPTALRREEVLSTGISDGRGDDARQFATSRGFIVAATESTTALIAFMFRDQLKQLIEAEIKAAAEDDGALGIDEREKRVKAIDAEILALERHEAEMVWALDDLTLFRGDIDVRAVLGIQGPPSNED